MTRKPHVPPTRYQVPGIDAAAVRTVAAVVGTLIVQLYEKGDAVRIDPRPPSPSTCFPARAARGR